MKLSIRGVGLDLTPSIKTYIENRLLPLSKLIEKFDEPGEAEIWCEIKRTTRHHKSGNVFWAAADLRLPRKMLRAESTSDDARAAIDGIKNKLRLEIEKYKTVFLVPRRAAKDR